MPKWLEFRRVLFRSPLGDLDGRVSRAAFALQQPIGEIVDRREELRIKRADRAEYLGRRAVRVWSRMRRVHQRVVEVDFGPIRVVARRGRVRRGDGGED